MLLALLNNLFATVAMVLGTSTVDLVFNVIIKLLNTSLILMNAFLT